MDRFTRVRWSLLLISLFSQIASARIHHDLDVSIDPDQGYLEAADRISLPESVSEISFSLHAGLKLSLETPGARVASVEEIESFAPIKQYKIRLPTDTKELDLKYSGKLHNRLKYTRGDRSGNQDTTEGIISGQGVFLSISSYWYPVFANTEVTFTLKADLPDGWTCISQGEGIGSNSWRQVTPQDDIYLIAGRYHLYRQPGDVAEAQAYLLHPDKVLAERYLKATGQYLQLFSDLLGPYPYPKFAMVENIWESGYGMPSFTLLGSKVIRLPFILDSSYPHEILHNWWGNGVFVDYAKGNWSEGMTTYLADHMLQEQYGHGSQYRRDALQSYANYVTANREYPLKDFRGYHGQASQAIGYGKGMMFLHMLRQRLGDRPFLEGLRSFYRDNLYRTASFDELKAALEKVSKKDLSAEFAQWTGRTGAPLLEVKDVVQERHYWGYQLSFTLRQTQKDEPYRLLVPVYIQTEDETEAIQKSIVLFKRETRTTVTLDERPLAVSVDPLFDLFRHLDPSEIPSSIGQLFGAKELMIILPSQADDGFKSAYRQVADGWKRQGWGASIVWDNEIGQIPKDKAVWLFGQENLLAGEFLKGLGKKNIALEGESIRIDEQRLSLSENSFVLTDRGSMASGWLHGHSLTALPGLARKVPHYGKYSYLAFAGDNPDNILKGQWPTTDSDLTLRLEADAPPMNVPEHKPLIDLIR